MDKKQINDYFRENKYAEYIDAAEAEMEDEYDEYSMLKCGEAYLYIDEFKKAKKILKRMHNLFPAGDYLLEWEKLVKDADAQRNPAKDRKEALAEGKAEKKKEGHIRRESEREIPQNIQGYFQHVAGLYSVQVELDRFYKLLSLQSTRKENAFDTELISTSHFVVTGSRGCGKTMVANIIAHMLKDFQIRETDRVVTIEPTWISGAFDNEGEEGVMKLFRQYHGSTVIIENMETMVGNGNSLNSIFVKKFGDCLHNLRKEVSIVLTASESFVRQLMGADPNMEDRFWTIIKIPPYTPDELVEIFKALAQEKKFLLDGSAESTLKHKLEKEMDSDGFLNAITLNRYIKEAAIRLAERFAKIKKATDRDMVCFMPEDFDVEESGESLEELLAQLERLTGLKEVKAAVKKRIETIAADQQAKAAGSKRKGGSGTLHMLFTGNPGTGKTTVARLLGRIYQQLGVLPRGDVTVECTRSDLVAGYVGQTAINVQKKIKEAQGGVLFIDEAYSLVQNENDSFGHEAVDELIAGIENNKDSMMVILAGYDREMEEFLKTNPGFKSRIRNTIHFEDYTTEEMAEIFYGILSSRGLTLSAEAKKLVIPMLDVKSKVPDFGNARGVRNIADDLTEYMNARIMQWQSEGRKLSKEDYETVLPQDIEQIAACKGEEEKTIEELLAQLNRLTGLSSVKAKVQEMVDDLRVKQFLKEQGVDNDSGHGTLHLVFKGNAGTGKTTVARLLGQIYKKLGILSKNVFVETGRKDLVAGYMGQTAKQVLKKVEEAQGGILFIDEAYTLVNGDHDEFGMEAVSALVAELENRRDDLMCIVAGYGDDMDRFLDANQGLASRLSNEIYFEDYTIHELVDIFKSMVKGKGMKLADDVTDEILAHHIQEEKDRRKDFGNARGVRNIIETVEKKKNTRIAGRLKDGKVPTAEEALTIVCSDLEE